MKDVSIKNKVFERALSEGKSAYMKAQRENPIGTKKYLPIVKKDLGHKHKKHYWKECGKEVEYD